MTNPHDNTIMFAKSIPKTMPMLPNDPRHVRFEFLITYRGHKQSVGIELPIPPEEIPALRRRMEQVVIAEANFFNEKAKIDERSARI